MNHIAGIVCSPRAYEFKGWLFEVSVYSGPWPLRKDWSPRKNAGPKFWKVWDEFEALTKEQQEACRVGGGCMRF